MAQIENGPALFNWLQVDGAIDYYEDEIIRGYAAGCMHCGGFNGMEYDEDEISTKTDEYIEENNITFEDCNGIDDLDDSTRQIVDATLDPIISFVYDNLDECTEHIKDGTIVKFLEDNVETDDDYDNDYFCYIMNKIKELI